jgi:hypothetical protein
MDTAAPPSMQAKSHGGVFMKYRNYGHENQNIFRLLISFLFAETTIKLCVELHERKSKSKVLFFYVNRGNWGK